MHSPRKHQGPWDSPSDRRLFWYILLTALMTLSLLGIGGMVTSKGAGMSVPDWPTSNGYNMFALPFSHWIGGVLYEHSHRLVASVVGLLTVFLTRWLGGYENRRTLALIGAIELMAGLILPKVAPSLRGTGHFLAGIGGVVLLAALLWVRNAPAPKPLPLLGWIAFWGVQLQGLLGGLRVVLLKDEIGVFHAVLAQLFFALLCVIALLHVRFKRGIGTLRPGVMPSRLVWVGTGLIFIQLIIGASMRHAHAGLAIPDFPTAYGRLWPDTSPQAIATYNSQRIEVFAANQITSGQVHLHMTHRIVAALICCVTVLASTMVLKRSMVKSAPGILAIGWLALILVQAGLGAATVWTNKAADIATLHLLVGGYVVCVRGCIVSVLIPLIRYYWQLDQTCATVLRLSTGESLHCARGYVGDLSILNPNRHGGKQRND